MILLGIASAGFLVGLVHSLAPGHWLPVVLMTRTRRWSVGTGIMGALVTASGHIILSIVLAVVGIFVGAQLLSQYEHEIESYAGLGVGLFGLAYAIYSWFSHSKCHGCHSHHGPEPRKGETDLKSAVVFLFSVGFSPCVAALPVFVLASTHGLLSLMMSMAAFAGGVIFALTGATTLVSLGIMKLDHPIFEHYGDVITGLGVALMGVFLFLFPH